MPAQITRQREEGTFEFWPKTGEERIAAFRHIVEHKQYGKIDNFMVDLFSASAVVKVYDACNEVNKAKFVALPANKMAQVAFKLIK